MFFGCGESEKEIQSNISELMQQRNTIHHEVAVLMVDKDNLNAEISQLKEKQKELKIIDSGKNPQYILKLEMKQSHLLSISKMIKDEMNKVDFEIPVDKDFYDKVKVGDKLVNDFRVGSFILEGSMGNWDLKIIKKEIR